MISNHPAARDSGRPLSFHILRHRPGARERGRYHFMRRTVLLVLAALIPACAFGFWASYEVRPDGFRERPWITVFGGWTNEATTAFIVIFDHADEYLHLDLRDQNDNSLSHSPLRGDTIQGAMLQETAVKFGCEALWKKGKATVYRFTVNSQLLNKSRISWQFGPPHDERGNPSTGGVLEWCYLSTLVQASRNANKDGAANRSQPVSSRTNRAPAAAGSGR